MAQPVQAARSEQPVGREGLVPFGEVQVAGDDGGGLLGMANTRMKDYFDLWVLLTDGALESTELRRAIDATMCPQQP